MRLGGVLLTVALFGFLAAPQKQPAGTSDTVSPVPYGSFGKQFEISKPGFVYSGRYASFQEIDPKNFVVHTFLKKRHLICGKLTRGHWEAKEEGGFDALDFVKSYALPSTDENSKYLLVVLEQSSAYGNSESDHYAQIWRLRDEKLSIEQQISYNTHFSDNGDRFEHFFKKDSALQVRSSHYLEHDAHCCISAYDELTFQWSGGDYVLTRIETKRTPAASYDPASKSEKN